MFNTVVDNLLSSDKSLFIFSLSSIPATPPSGCPFSTWATPSWAAASWACPSPWLTLASCSSRKYFCHRTRKLTAWIQESKAGSHYIHSTVTETKCLTPRQCWYDFTFLLNSLFYAYQHSDRLYLGCIYWHCDLPSKSWIKIIIIIINYPQS